MTISDTVFSELPAQPYQTVRTMVRDGDLLLCSATDPGSRLIRWATRSIWSHVAIAFWLVEAERAMVLECVEKIGVRCVPLSDFTTRTSSGQTPYPGKILLARHQAIPEKPQEATMKRMSSAAFARLGAKFSSAEIVKIASRITFGRLGRKLPGRLEPDDEYICSEYVAKCFESAGMKFEWDGLGFIAPHDIARDPHVVPVAQIETTSAMRNARQR